jgi:hypothetical protein
VSQPPAIAPFLDVLRAADLQAPSTSAPPWLIEQLWSAHAVGVLGGAPKSYKTWLALEMAVSVASGSPCLATFPVPSPGPVMLYAAEDSQAGLRSRLESLTQHHRLDLHNVDIRVIIENSWRLDRDTDQQRLYDTLLLHRPALLVLDPLVRLHSIDENAAGEMAPLLGYLRSLQREFGVAIVLTHHSRKNASASGGDGYSLRGSSDLYAWVDSFLYLRRHQGQLLLSAEHRSASGAGPWPLELAQADSGPYLKLASTTPSTPPSDPLINQLIGLLAQSSQPQTAESLRSSLQVRNQRLVAALRQLCDQGAVVRLPQGYALQHPPSPNPPKP